MKKFIDKIILSALFSILVAGSTSAIAWLLDPAIKKIFVEKKKRGKKKGKTGEKKEV